MISVTAKSAEIGFLILNCVLLLVLIGAYFWFTHEDRRDRRRRGF